MRALSKVRNAGTMVDHVNTAPVGAVQPHRRFGKAYPPVDEPARLPAFAAAGRVTGVRRPQGNRPGSRAIPLGLNMVMLGALYGAADMPLTKESQMEAIRKNGKPAFVESNLNCFERGFKAASEETAKD